jgi:hypothetical protein
MKTYQDWLNIANTPQPYGNRRPLKEGDFFDACEMHLEAPLENADYIMNRRNNGSTLEPQPINLSGYKVDPMDETETIKFNHARNIYYADDRNTYDGVSIVLPIIPKPITKINGNDYYLVAGLYKNGVTVTKFEYAKVKNHYRYDFSSIFMADMLSLGYPLYGVSPTRTSSYFFALSAKPIVPFEDQTKKIFSYGDVIAIGRIVHNNYSLTGEETTIRILSCEAIKLIEKWRNEASQ